VTAISARFIDVNINARNELVEVLAEISRLAPFVRLGQLVCNLTTLASREEPYSVWDVEDEELLAAARQHLEDLRRLPPEVLEVQTRAHQDSDALAAAKAATAS